MLKANNVKLTWSDGACEIQFSYQPHIDQWMEHLQINHSLTLGGDADYHLGYKYHCILSWKRDNFFRGSQLDDLRELFNTHDGLCIYPAPDTHPNQHFLVKWVNDFDFHLKQGAIEMGYNGTIELRGAEVLSEIDEYYPLANTF